MLSPENPDRTLASQQDLQHITYGDVIYLRADIPNSTEGGFASVDAFGTVGLATGIDEPVKDGGPKFAEALFQICPMLNYDR